MGRSDYTTILNLTLTESMFQFYEFNHSRLNFFIKLERCSRSPLHSLVDERHEISDLGHLLYVDLSDPAERLGGWPISLIESRKIETFMMSESQALHSWHIPGLAQTR